MNNHLAQSLSLDTQQPIPSEYYQVNYGAYWTPKRLVDICYSLVYPHITPASIFLDSSAGFGSFIARLSNHPTIAADINPQAVRFLRQRYGSQLLRIKQDNSLWNIGRSKYNLSPEDHLIIIGNPPYNDRTSKNRAAKKCAAMKIEPSLQKTDMGISFLLSYAKLKADIICVLHPLSYLIKPTNFRKLSYLWEDYHLLKGIIFSSHHFNNTGSTPFPIVAALYRRGRGMNYNDLCHHTFDILDQNKHFELNRIETIDGYIRKYPPLKKERQPSDIGLYFYNFRDSNSLWTSANFTERENYHAHITITRQNFYQYAYLGCYKRYFPRQYIFGNLSPLVTRTLLEQSKCFQSACIVDTIINSPRLQPLTARSFRQEQQRHMLSLLKDDYSFLARQLKKLLTQDFKVRKDTLSSFFKHYFTQLAAKSLDQEALSQTTIYS